MDKLTTIVLFCKSISQAVGLERLPTHLALNGQPIVAQLRFRIHLHNYRHVVLKSLHLGTNNGRGVHNGGNRCHTLGSKEGANALVKHATTLVLTRLRP